MIVNVPLDRIRDNPFQPRQTYPDIQELAEKIKAMKGVLPREELRALPPGVRVREIVPLAVPGLEASRHLILLERA